MISFFVLALILKTVRKAVHDSSANHTLSLPLLPANTFNFVSFLNFSEATKMSSDECLQILNI